MTVSSTVELRNVSVTLGGARVVDRVSVVVGAGEWLGVIGPNGAGKTSLLRAVAGLVAANGEVVVGGKDPATLRPRERARAVAYVPQDPHLPTGMTVEEYVLLGRTAHVSYFGVESRADLATLRQVIRLLELERLATRPLTELSGGERQRAVLARALAQESPVLLLDEPTAALDIGHQQQVLELLDDLRRDRGLTVLTAIHDLTLAAQFADRLLLLSRGAAVAVGAPSNVLTEEAVSEHWGVSVRILEDEHGVVVVPRRTTVTIPTREGRIDA